MSAQERDLDELLGAYALDAVSLEERTRVEEYLLVSPRARHEVAEYRETATMLAWSGMVAPEGLWDRIAKQIDDAEAPAVSAELASVMSIDRQRARRGWGRSASAWLVATAAAAAVAFVAVTALDRNRTETSPLAAAVSAAQSDRTSRVAHLAAADGTVAAEAVIDTEGHGYLIGSNLPALSDDHTYQLWGVIGDKVISLGVLGPDPEIGVFNVDGAVTTLVVTNEAAGGVVSNGNPDGAYAGAVA
jgi:anti-sigma-K factor RskA